MKTLTTRIITRSALAASIAAAASVSQAQTSNDFVITNVTVISPERAAPLEDAHVRILDGQIADISQRPITGTGEEIDGRGRYLIPGLIDSHVHLGEIPGMRGDHEAAYPEITAATRAQIPRSYLYFGFTTLVDLAGGPEGTAAWNAQDVRPDAYFCGAAPIANGYPMAYVPEAVRFRAMPYFLYDETQADSIPDDVDPAHHTPEAVVARMAGEGAICAKMHYETGFGAMRNLPTPGVEMAQALVSAAHARGMPVFVHGNSRAAQAFGLAAGADVIAHGMWHGHELTEDGALSREAAAIVGEVISGRVGYQPTFQVLAGEMDLFEPGYLDDARLAHAAPATLIDWYRTDEADWFRAEIAAGLDGADPATIYGPIFTRLGGVVEALAEADANLLFGSDTPSAPTYTNFPGLNARLEMDRWTAANVSATKLFDALTIDNAEALGLEDKIGTVEPGKTAHLLLLRENPLESASAYDTIDTVFLAGRPIQRETLSVQNVDQ